MEATFIYLASPYWHEREIIRIARVNMVRKKTAALMEEGYVVYSPICHNHPVAAHLPSVLRHSHDFWMKQDLVILNRADELWVLTLDDWQVSRGVTKEIEFAKIAHKPIRYIAYDELAHRSDPDLPNEAAPLVRSEVAAGPRGFDR